MLPLLLPPGPLKVLCLGAHCDDVDIGCGATLLSLLREREGCEVHWRIFSSTPERAAELRASADAFLEGAGARRVATCEFRESFFPWEGGAIKDEFERFRHELAPDVVLTHYREDRHQDHRVISDLTWNTFRSHLVLEYEIPKYDGDLGRPSLYVPVPEAVARRKASLLVRHYPSQTKRPWFSEETFLGLMRIRGIECNAPEGYAEAFHARKLVLGPGLS